MHFEGDVPCTVEIYCDGEGISLACQGQEPLQRPHTPSTVLNS